MNKKRGGLERVKTARKDIGLLKVKQVVDGAGTQMRKRMSAVD
jgi:hypothetical protein